jgi:hypothetical protein
MPLTKSSANFGNSGNSGDLGNSSDFGNSSLSDDPISIMNDLEESISDFLVCSDAQRTILALWILHTYSYRQTSFVTPYLNIYSHVEQSGKSVCMGLLRALCAQPWLSSGVPATTLTRKILAHRPTVLLDNWHTTFRGRDQQPITGFLLHGCQAAQPVTLLEKGSLREVDLYCPKAFAGMASLPPTLAQRSIPIVLQRCLPQQHVIPVFHLLDPRLTRDFISWAQQWTQGNLDPIYQNIARFRQRKSLGALSPHQRDCSQPLLGLAETIGGDWPQRACTALLEVFREEQDRNPSAVQLLSDVRAAFAHHNTSERIFTAELLEYLHSLDHRTWYEWSKGQPMNAHALSALLRKFFNIYPRSQRRGKQKLRGYQKADFADAWERYLPGPHADGSEENAVANNIRTAAANAAAEDTNDEPSLQAEVLSSRPVPAVRGLPNSPEKSRVVSMSQFKTGWKKRWAKNRSIVKQLIGKAVGLFTVTRT